MMKTPMLSAVALVILTGSAVAQTTTTQSTTVTAPTALPAPVTQPAPTVPMPAPGASSSTESQRSVDAYGNEVDSTKSTYENADGSQSQSSTTTTQPGMQPAMPGSVTTIKKTTTTSTSD